MPLKIIGDHSFQQSGPPQWSLSFFDLDQMRLAFRGGIDLLDDYLDSLVDFQASPVDPNMNLIQVTPDNHKQFPTVEHTYLGKKGGILPPGKHEDFDQVLSASAGAYDVQFYAPTSRLTWVSKIERAPGPSGLLVAPPGRAVSIISLRSSSGQPLPPNVFNFVLATVFSEININTIRSVEEVPGLWWRNTQDVTKTLIPFAFQSPDGALHIKVVFVFFASNTAPPPFGGPADTSTADIMRMKDSTTGKIIGVYYDNATQLWHLHTDVGAGADVTVSMSRFLVYGTVATSHFVDMTLSPTGTGSWHADVVLDNVAFPRITIATAATIDQLFIGAIGGSGTPERAVIVSTIGTFAGGADLFAGLLTPTTTAPPPVVPPYTANSGGTTYQGSNVIFYRNTANIFSSFNLANPFNLS